MFLVGVGAGRETKFRGFAGKAKLRGGLPGERVAQRRAFVVGAEGDSHQRAGRVPEVHVQFPVVVRNQAALAEIVRPLALTFRHRRVRHGEPAAQFRAGAHEGRASALDEVRGVHVNAVRCLGDVEWHPNSLGEPLVRRDIELTHRLFVPEVIRLRQGLANVNCVDEVKTSGTVVHQWILVAHVLTKGTTERGVFTGVTPRVNFDRRVTEFDALGRNVQVLF